MKFVFTPHVHTRIADTETPISLYLKIREHFAECLLVESNGTTNPQKRYSYICCLPIATITVGDRDIKKQYPDGNIATISLQKGSNIIEQLESFIDGFAINTEQDLFETQGLYGYMSYDIVPHFETIELSNKQEQNRKTDLLHFSFYSVVLVFDHFKQVYHIIEYESAYNEAKNAAQIKALLLKPIASPYPFKAMPGEITDCTDTDFLQRVQHGRDHCLRGDVFQIVLSRSFSTAYTGDDFMVYRTLRSINPSPYLFYFDYGGYHLFGASPEAQLKVRAGIATIHPIAGTYKRGATPEEDHLQSERLKQDPKENAEHTMLVDLARNDLSKHYRNVQVTAYKQIQQYAYVIHMVSEVSGAHPVHAHSSLQVIADTFPAGTLSGAPKYRAMQLIDQYETEARGFYGGSIGFIGFNGDINLAIMIRTVLSKDQKLHYQAGAGIVSASVAEQELQEVNNKLKAIRTSIERANTLSNENTDY